jgi:hypothetical protein
VVCWFRVVFGVFKLENIVESSRLLKNVLQDYVLLILRRLRVDKGERTKLAYLHLKVVN